MSEDTPERAEPDPARRRTGRTVSPIIDLKADAPKEAPASGSPSALKEESSTMFHRSNATIAGPLVLGALAGAIAGTVATFLILALPTKSKDNVALRLSTLEANQSLFSTSDRSSALEQQTAIFEKKFLTLEDGLTRQNQKITDLAEANKSLSEILASTQKSFEAASGGLPAESLSNIMTQIETLNVKIDQIKSDIPIIKTDERSKLVMALVLLMSAKDRLSKNQTIAREVDALKTLNLSFYTTDDLNNLTMQIAELQITFEKAYNQPSQNPSSNEWSDRLWSGLSRLVTISSVEEKSGIKQISPQDTRLKTIENLILQTMDRLITENATP